MKKNVLSVDFHISQYGKIVEELRKEVSCSVLCRLVWKAVLEGPLTVANISRLWAERRIQCFHSAVLGLMWAALSSALEWLSMACIQLYVVCHLEHRAVCLEV